MRRLAVAVLAALCGLAAGALVSDATTATVDASPTPTLAATPALGDVETEDRSGVVVVWTPGGLDPVVPAALTDIDGVTAFTVVRGGPVEMLRSENADGTVVDDPPRAAVIPLDALAVDPDAYASVLSVGLAKTVATLAAGEVLLGETSAKLRRLASGDHIELAGGQRFTVAAVVPDDIVAGAEVVFTLEGGTSAGITTDRSVLAVFDGDRTSLDTAIHKAVAVPVRIRGPAETPFLRHGDAVLTQAEIKQRFGEFSYTPMPDGTLRIDPAWEAEHLVTTVVPLLGQLRCHRTIVDALGAAMQQLVDDGLGHLVLSDSFGGCWNPRHIGPDEGLSRHSWGIAVDINVSKNPTGVHAAMDERVVEALEGNGFTWGGRWLVPDPAHFECRHP